MTALDFERRAPARGRQTKRVIVVGAGLGGLAAAMTLAAQGAAVTLLERASRTGGKLRAFDSAAGPVDAGPTVLTMRHVLEDLFARTGARLEERVTLTREPLLARHFWHDGAQLDLFDDRRRSADAVRAFAGGRAGRQFEAFARTAERLFDAFQKPVMEAPAPSFAAMASHVALRPWLAPLIAPHKTLARALEGAFEDPRLRQLFGRYATYVGGSPESAPAILSLIWHAEASGVWRVAGGMRMLADAMAARARELGVEIVCDCDVERITMVGGAARAVLARCGARWTGDAVLYAGDPAALRLGLLGADVAEAVPAEAVAPRSLSANVWAFAAEPSGPDLAHHNVFFSAEPNSEFRDIAAGRAPTDPTLYICAQDRGGPRAPGGAERFEIIANAAAVRDAAAPQPPSEEEKEQCRTRTFRALARFGLTFSPEPGTAALTTPPEFAALFPGSAGSLYGLSPEDLKATFKRPTARSAAPGLYLAGGGTHPGAGVPMATSSGLRAAEAIGKDLALTSTSRLTAMRGGM